MAWSTSDRRSQLPRDWRRRREHVLLRDRRTCQIADPNVCIVVATEVDHITPGNDHSYINLQAVCSECHLDKTIRESKAKAKPRKAVRKHPGWL